MAYQPAISSKIVQFNQTIITVRFDDDDAIMPTQFFELNWMKQSVSDVVVAAKIEELRIDISHSWDVQKGDL